MSFVQRPIRTAYAATTRMRVEAVNAKAAELEEVRQSIETDRRKIFDAAYARADAAASLRMRVEVVRDRVLQCDLDELALFGELEEVSDLARQDLQREAEHLKAETEERLRALHQAAEDSGLEPCTEAWSRAVDFDPHLCALRRAQQHAQELVDRPLLTHEDKRHAEQLQAAILRALT